MSKNREYYGVFLILFFRIIHHKLILCQLILGRDIQDKKRA